MIKIDKNCKVEKNTEPDTDTAGTYLQDWIEVDYNTLLNTFGKPNGCGDGYKVQAEWIIETPDGVATLYDYKMGDCYNGEGQGIRVEEVIDWHIGGYTKGVVDWIKKVLGIH